MADHGVRPDAALLAADFRLGRKGEAADFFPRSGRRLGEDECTGAFIEAVEHAVGGTDGAFAEALVHPDFGSGAEILADPAVVVVIVLSVAATLIVGFFPELLLHATRLVRFAPL